MLDSDMFLISINFVSIIAKRTLLPKILDILVWDALLEYSLVKFLPTNLESEWKIYGIDLHYMYVLIKETKVFLSGDKKNKQIQIQVLASSLM